MKKNWTGRLMATTALVAPAACAAALLAGATLDARPARAGPLPQCNADNTSVTIPGCINPGTSTLVHLNFTNATSNGNVVNAGTISPGGVNLVNSTINGQINNNTGTIAGGINIDANSKVSPTSPTHAIRIHVTATFGGGVSNAGTLSSLSRGIDVSSVSTFTGGITNTGSVSGASGPAIALTLIRSFAGGIFNSGSGSIVSQNGVGIGVQVSNFSGGITNAGSVVSNSLSFNHHALDISGSCASAFSGGISNTGTLSANCGHGVRVQLTTFSGGISNGGTISGASSHGFDGINLSVSTFLGGIVNTGLVTGFRGINLTGTSGVSVFDSGTITGTSGTAIQFGGGVNTLTLGPGYVINGNVLNSAGAANNIFQLGGTGSGNFDLSTIGSTQQYQGFTTFNAVSGTWTVFSTFGQTNPWTVQGGTLLVAGDLSAASSITVNSGGTLGGNGILPSTTILGGGTLAPGSGSLPAALAAGKSAIAGGAAITNGNVLTIQGNLVMASAAAYLVQVSPTSASRTNVSGTAGIGGTLTANATGGTYTVGTKYTVLTAAGGVSGTFSLATTGAFGLVRPVLSYDANDVFLTLNPATLSSLLTPGATINERDVAGAIDAFILGGGTLPPGFQNIFNFSPQQIQNALNQLTGEVGTGAQQTGFQLMTEFMNLLFGSPGGAGGGGAMGFAPERETLPPDVALAYASVLKARPAAARLPVSVWASAYGGANKTNGDPAVVGSSDLSARTFGMAVGLDYQVAADTKVGFALAGAGAAWSLSGGLGSGSSNAIQAGIYGSRQFGPAYISGALAGATYQMTTNRTLGGPVLPADQLTANFSAQSLGGRLEGGYRIPAFMAFGVTPYAAVQLQSFWTPSYSEAGQLNPDPFALTFASRQATATRTELGSRFDRVVPTMDGDLGLFGRVAWAHDSQSNPSVTPAFLGLPTPSFVINGATPRRDKALLTTGAEWRLRQGWSLTGKFDGELASGSATYAGTAQVKYTW